MNAKIFTLFLFLSGMVFHSAAQADLIIDLEAEDLSVAIVLNKLSDQYDLSFAFDSYELSRLKGSWKFSAQPLSLVLDEILTPFHLAHKLVGSTFIIFPLLTVEIPEENVSDVSSEVFEGELRDRNSGELLPFAVLAWIKSEQSFTTNNDGKFNITKPSIANDSLRVFFVGYEALVIPENDLKSNKSNKLFVLPQRYYLPDIEVSARLTPAISASGDEQGVIINPQELLSRYGLGEPDLFRTAQLLPGVSATNESNNGLFLRGSNSDQTLITLDGFTIYHLDHLFGTFSAINANSVKAMKLYSGPLESRFGGRAAGMLEMIGREGSNYKSALKVDIGTMSVGMTAETPIDSAGRATFFATVRRSVTDFIYSPPYRELFNTIYDGAKVSDDSNTDTFREIDRPDFYFQDANVKLTYRPSSRDVVNLSLYASRDQLYVQYADTFSNETVNTTDVIYTDESTKKNQGASLRWVHGFDQRWQASFLLAASGFDGQFFSTDTIYEPLFASSNEQFSAEERSLGDIAAKLDFTGDFRRHKISWGVHFNRLQTEVKINENGILSDLRKDAAAVPTIYAEDHWIVFPGIEMQGGIRVNYFDRNKSFYPEPRASLFWKINNHLKFNLGFGRNCQFIQRVQIQDLYLNKPDVWEIGGGQFTDVLRADQFSFGLKLNYRKWTLQTDFFNKWNRGIAFSPGRYAEPLIASSALPEIISGNGFARGVDILVDYFHKHHHLLASYTLLRAETHYGEIYPARLPEFFEQRHEMKLAYEFQIRGWSFSCGWVYGSGRPYTPYLGDLLYTLPNDETRKLPYFGQINSARLPAYHRLELAIAKQFTLGSTEMNITAAVYNVYDRNNVRDYQYRALRPAMNSADFTGDIKAISMIGFLPTLHLSFKF
jgi:ferric enterobactin receptor